MTYQETLDFLFSQLPMYQKEGKSAYKKDLGNTLALMEALDNPQRKFKSVHIAGTNGKGTCAHGIAAIMQLSGYKTGLYTSPHLKSFTERIRINGEEIEEQQVVSFVGRIAPVLKRIKPSFFEITVAMAFDYFSAKEVDIAIIETGLGGRLDSTNVIVPEASLITNIGFDHVDLLGYTLEQIAEAKAGIIKSGAPVVIGKYQEETFPVFVRKAKEVNTRLVMNQDFGWSEDAASYPYYKALNKDAVYQLAQVLKSKGWKIPEEYIAKGFLNLETITKLKGRYQVLQSAPKVIADVSHNVEGLSVLFQQVVSSAALAKGKLILIFGTVKDKDLTPIFKLVPKDALIFWTESTVPRSLPVEELAIQGIVAGLKGECFKDVNEAIKMAKQQATADDTVLVTGSTFVVSEIEDL